MAGSRSLERGTEMGGRSSDSKCLLVFGGSSSPEYAASKTSALDISIRPLPGHGMIVIESSEI